MERVGANRSMLGHCDANKSFVNTTEINPLVTSKRQEIFLFFLLIILIFSLSN